MPSLHETAYPRLRTSVTPKDLEDVYTPTVHETRLADSVSRGFPAKVYFLVLLKTFQRLGYFVLLRDVPDQIISHIAKSAGGLPLSIDAAAYDDSGTRRRHVLTIRGHLKVKPYSESGEPQELLANVLRDASQRKEDLADIINVGIEELVRNRFELPAFRTLHDKAQAVRAEVNNTIFNNVAEAIEHDGRRTIDELFIADDSGNTSWQTIKEDPGPPTISHLRELVKTIEWLLPHDIGAEALASVPDAKVKQFAAEAKSLDAHRMRSMECNKRYTLAAALIGVQIARGLDDIAEMFIKRMTKIHHQGKEALADYRIRHQSETDRLVVLLQDVLTQLSNDGPAEERIAAMRACLGEPVENVIERCQAYAAYSNGNYNGFLWKYYQTHRQTLFRLLEYIALVSTSQDHTVENALAFLRNHRTAKADWLDISDAGPDGRPLELSWVSDKWWKLVTGLGGRGTRPTRVDRRQFEVCLFSQIMTELKAGDMCIDGSDRFSDDRDQLVSWDDYHDMVDDYAEQVGLTADSDVFVQKLRRWLDEMASATDASFPSNKNVRIEDGQPRISRLGRKPSATNKKKVERLIAQRIEHVSILDVLVDTENWLGWTKSFGPLSGYDARIDDALEENDRDKQRKIIKYNHLVANCLIFHNVQSMSRVLREFTNEGQAFDDEVLSQMNPYLTGHVNRFGKYALNMGRTVAKPEYQAASTEVLAGATS